MKDLRTKDYKMLIKETKEDTNIWGNSLYSQIERMNNATIYIIPKVIYSSAFALSRFHPKFIMGTGGKKRSLNVYGTTRDPRYLKQSFVKQKEVGSTLFPGFKLPDNV